MDISRSQNKNTVFFKLLAWLCRIKLDEKDVPVYARLFSAVTFPASGEILIGLTCGAQIDVLGHPVRLCRARLS